MTDVSSRNFGYLIAYVIPGFIVVATLSVYSPIIRSWIGVSTTAAPTVGGFMYVTIGSALAGLVLSAVRWLVVDTFHHRTGIQRPPLDFSAFQKNRAAFDALALNHFRYYEFFAHTALAMIFAISNPWEIGKMFTLPAFIVLPSMLALILLLLVASRDALRKYYGRTRALLGQLE
jgi:hypothetical protein